MATRTRRPERATYPVDDDYAREPRRGGGGGWGVWAIVALVVAGLLAWAIWATVDDDSAGIDQGATASEILENPDRFTAERVAVSGEVGDLVGENAFTLGGGLLVVSADPPAQLTDDSVLQAIGRVRTFSVAEFEDVLGVDLDDGLFTEFESRPAIAAEEINLDVNPEAGPQNVTLENVLENPSELDGETVTVDGTVTEVVSTQAFILDEALLVVARADAGADVEIGQMTRVTGTVSEAFEVAEAEEELGVTFDEGELFTDWVGQPGILADDVHASP